MQTHLKVTNNWVKLGAVQYVYSRYVDKSADKLKNVADKLPTRDLPTKFIFSTDRTFIAYTTKCQNLSTAYDVCNLSQCHFWRRQRCFLTMCNDHSTEGKDERRFASGASTERPPAERPALFSSLFSSSYDILDKFLTNCKFFVQFVENILLLANRESALCLRHICYRHIASRQIVIWQIATHP